MTLESLRINIMIVSSNKHATPGSKVKDTRGLGAGRAFARVRHSPFWIAAAAFILFLISNVSQASTPTPLIALVTDLVSEGSKSDDTPADGTPTPTLICSPDEGGKVDLEIKLENHENQQNAVYKWTINKGSEQVANGELKYDSDPNKAFKEKKEDLELDPELHTLRVRREGESLLYGNSRRRIDLLPVGITVAFGLGPEPLAEKTSRELLEDYLETIKISRTGDIWFVKHTDAQGVEKMHGVEIVTTKEKLIAALKRTGQKVVFDGHSNFGLGPNFSGKVTHKSIVDFTNFGVGRTSIPKSFRGEGTEIDVVPFTNGDGAEWPTNPEDIAAIERVQSEGWAYLKLNSGQIIEAPENYQITELGIERFKNLQGVTPGNTFTKQGSGFNNEWHFDSLEGSRRLIVQSPSTDVPELGYAKFFYNACNTGRDYIESFNHGDFIYTKDSCRVGSATQIFTQGIIESKSNSQIMTNLNQDGVGNVGNQSPQIYGIETF